MSSPGNNSSLRPSWYKGSGSGGGKGFQPPPTATDRGDKGRSPSVGSAGESRRDSNKFAALLDDDDVVVGNGVELSSSPKVPPSSNSRSEAFRSSFNRSSATGAKAAGRSLAALAAKAPEASTTGRRHSAYAEGARAGTGRFPRAGDAGAPGGAIDSYKPDPKVVRYTREKLLSLRPGTRGEDPGPPDVLKPLEDAVVLSPTAQDPVCWDTFDAESIWETVRERRSSAIATKPGLEGDPRRRNAPSRGRWSRGLALPPQEEAARRKERDAENPNELWDDPMGGATGAAADFSAFGAMPSDDDDNVFDFDKMAEASRKLEEEIHGGKHDDDDDSSEQHVAKKVDVSRPLASAGTTLVSGSGDDVNVFEDFDSPSDAAAAAAGKEAKANGPGETPSVRGGGEDPSASSRLMKMIGVSRETNESNGLSEDPINNPWGSDPVKSNSAAAVDPIIGAIGGGAISLNPWGGPSQQGGMNLGIGLGGAFDADATSSRDAQLVAEREKIAQREVETLRRRQEEEQAQRRSMAEQKARQQQASIQQQTPQQSQIELVLMERICKRFVFLAYVGNSIRQLCYLTLVSLTLLQGPFRGEEMRQWLEAGYFKGDLPISQVSSGPFHPLSVWFPNLRYAFQLQPTNGQAEDQKAAEAKAAAEMAEKERLEQEAVERERRAAEEAQAAAARREAQENEAAAMEAERQKQAEANSNNEDAVNQSSNQLKMMLGLGGGAQPSGEDEHGKAELSTTSKSAKTDKKARSATKKTSQKVVGEAPAPAAAASAAPAWGGAANSKQTRKSMSEIQQEEARAAAMLAAKRGSLPQSSSGWANVAAGSSGWSSGAVRPGLAAQNAAAAGVRPSQASPMLQAATVQGGANRKVATLTQQQRSSSAASSTPAEEFGTSMSPALEKWCKEQMVQINGSDDLTLVGFCMTLNDANEIRQYLVTYLGSTQQVNSFATDFINKRGLGSKQEEWETPGSAKKGRKKKAGR
ncbi:MAG: hypothetical protein SGILL_001050 [Bacillariaceae sp.]